MKMKMFKNIVYSQLFSDNKFIVIKLLFVIMLGIVSNIYAVSLIELPLKMPDKMVELRRVYSPETVVRGYGSLQNLFVEYKNDKGISVGSVLIIRCANADKAGIILGKYNSDLRTFPGVKDDYINIEKKQIPISVVDKQGFVCALRQQNRVIIIIGQTANDAAKIIEWLKITSFKDVVFAGSSVPVFLDKFDKWGFGFWCNPPLKMPEKQENYDVREKFEWAKKMGTGLQIDIGLNQSVGAGGIIDDNADRWAIELARDMNIPVMVQMQGAPAPQWMANRYGDEMQRKVPDYIGSWYGINGNNGFPGNSQNTLGWTSVKGKNQQFSDLYKIVGKYQAFPNVTGYGEWHGEVVEGPVAMFLDSGPTADKRFREYLQEKLKTPQLVDKRWYNGTGVITKWDDIRMPEPAEFLGWGKESVSLKGEWRIKTEEQLTVNEKNNWGEVDLDDNTWKKLIAPGDDRQIFRDKFKVPTVFRRNFNINDDELTKLKSSGKTFLYVWSLEQGSNIPVRAYINGSKLMDQSERQWASWVVYDITDKVKTGGNNVALSLPLGMLSYKVYLSSYIPRCYPDLGKEMNNRWVDYRDFITWLREDGLRRSIESIRRQDPDKVIKLMAPHAVTDVMKALSEDYGCYFHDTGGMSGNWRDDLPALMRSSGMPMSLEPGNPAYELPSLKSYFGNWMTEGLQSVDYFMDISDIMWRPDQKAWFEEHLPLVHLMGKFHYPQAEVAVLAGVRSHRLTGFPWDHFDIPLLWNNRREGIGTLGRMPNPRDLINEIDFTRGNVNKYKVIVDDATLIMDDQLIAKIDEWVRAGGIFITQGQTGRHSPDTPDTWPIEKLTGYKFVRNNDNWRVGAIDGQPIFTDPLWTKKEANGTPVLGGAGVQFEKVAPECQDILQWPNKTIAMGVRQLGKGKIITMGTGMPYVSTGWYELLKWCGVNMPPAFVVPWCRTARFVSNNGLYDIYIVAANEIKEPKTVTIKIPGTHNAILNLLTGQEITGKITDTGTEITDFKMEPLETYAFAVPGNTLNSTSLDWIKLQREWWKGTKKPAPAPAVKPWPNSMLLDNDWAFRPVAVDAKDTESLIAIDVDDSKWDKTALGIWYGKKYTDVKKAVYRKRFTVPASWKDGGQTWLWLRGTNVVVFLPPYKTKIFLDGKLLSDSGGWKYANSITNLTDKLTPGEHLIAIITESVTPVGGIAGNLWLEHIPEPAARQDLSGDWNGIKLPGKTKPACGDITRTFTTDAAMKVKRAFLYVETDENNVIGIILNKRLIRRDIGGQHFLMDITAYLNADETNSITLSLQHFNNASTIKTVEIRYYDSDKL